MNGARILVTQGIHAGASMALESGREVSIGSGEQVELMLVDERVEAHHVTVRQEDGELVLQALRDGVTVFGDALAVNDIVRLRTGASFALGDATLQFSGPAAPERDEVDRAELAWLAKRARVRYAVKRWSAGRGRARWLIAALPLAGLAWGAWLLFAPWLAVPMRVQSANPAFRDVKVRADAGSGAAVYEGYVATSADLANLALTARADTRTAVMRVVVMEQLQEQLAEFLDKYYREARVRATTPGVFVVTLPLQQGYRLPESWDYARIARLARAQVDGLRALDFDGHAVIGGPVRVPLEALGLNLMHSQHAAWLADRAGGRFFAGAKLAIGTIKQVTRCGADIVRDDDGSVYQFYVSDDHEKSRC